MQNTHTTDLLRAMNLATYSIHNLLHVVIVLSLILKLKSS